MRCGMSTGRVGSDPFTKRIIARCKGGEGFSLPISQTITEA